MTGKWLRAACAAAAVAMLAAGCSSATSSGTTSTSDMNSMSFGAPEKTTLNVGVVPGMDSAGFFIALHEGLFAKEGLTINYTPQASSETAISLQKAGKLDISGGNYVSYIQAAENHPNDDGLEIVAEASIMEQGSQVILTMPNSKIKSLAQLRGQDFGINVPDNINFLLAASLLDENGINPSQVHFPNDLASHDPVDSGVAFPNMPKALANGTFAAAAMPEPFASQAEQQYGAVVLADQDQGATQNFPIEGYVVTKSWQQAHPNTLKRFLAALEQGQEIADTNREAVEAAYESLKGPANGQVPARIADVMALNNYPIGIDPTRLQRVSNVMFQFGLEPGRKQPFNISSMLLQQGQTGFFDFGHFETSTSASQA